MKPYIPKNAYEIVKIREEIKNYLERIERIEPNEDGIVLVDRNNIIMIKSKLQQGIDFSDCLLYMMSFNEKVNRND